MPSPVEPPSGTRDFLAGEVWRREAVFARIREVFERYGFGPLQTPAFERLEVLAGKYGEEGDKLIFKILRRGEHEASGEADLALRYDMTVPLARVIATYGSQLPAPYKRYAMGPVWRADRPGRGRFREFVQCDVDVVGSASPLADAEVVCAVAEALSAVGVADFRFLVNSRNALSALLEYYRVSPELGGSVLIALDKLDKQPSDQVIRELEERGLSPATAKALVDDLTAGDSTERLRSALVSTTQGERGIAEVDRLVELAGGAVGADRLVVTPSLVRGLDYYTGVIWEVVAPGVPGSIASGGRYDNLAAALGGPDLPATGGSLGVERILSLLPAGDDEPSRLDVAVTVMGEEYATSSFALASAVRAAGLRASVYLGSSGKLGRQLKWASDLGARWCLIYGGSEHAAGVVTVRDMESGDQTAVPVQQVGDHLARLASG